MKASLYSILFLFVCTSIVNGQVRYFAEEKIHKISVSGTGEVFAMPDKVSIRGGFETLTKDLPAGLAEMKRNEAKLVDFVKKWGLRGANFQLSDFSVFREYEYRDSGEKKEFLGYRIVKSFTIYETRLDKTEELLSALLSNGWNHVDGIEYSNSNAPALRQKARLMAVEAARDKAKKILESLGVKLGKPLEITIDENYGGAPAPKANIDEEVGAIDSAGNPGQLSFKIKVNITFEVE